MVPKDLRSPGHGRDHAGRLTRWFAPITLVGTGAGGMADGVCGRVRSGRYASVCVRPPFGASAARMTAVRKAPMHITKAAIIFACWRATGRARQQPLRGGSPSRTFRWNRSCSATRSGKAFSGRRRAGSVIMITYATSEDRYTRRCRRAPRPCNLGPSASDPDREKLGRNCRGRTMTSNPILERALAIEIARVTERAAVAAGAPARPRCGKEIRPGCR